MHHAAYDMGGGSGSASEDAGSCGPTGYDGEAYEEVAGAGVYLERILCHPSVGLNILRAILRT